MRLKYDSVDEARSKLQGTYCYYKNKAISVKAIEIAPKDFSQPILHPMLDKKILNEFIVIATPILGGKTLAFPLESPDFNCSRYNLGYLNYLEAAAWFYRYPVKQWKQGLRADKLLSVYSKSYYAHISPQPSKPFVNMLENNYFTYKESLEMLLKQQAEIVAFNKDFAIVYDGVHGDFILEHKGVPFSYTSNNKDYTFLPGKDHLKEVLMEAIGA